MEMLPKDPFMLLSYVNTQLRDNYSSLEDFAAGMGIEPEEIKEKLAKLNYIYDEALNKFISENQ